MINDNILFGQERGVILLLILILVGVLIYFIYSFIVKYRKYKIYQKKLAKRRTILRQQWMREKTINNFFYNRIEEDIDNSLKEV